MKQNISFAGVAIIAAVALHGAPAVWAKSSSSGEMAAKTICARCHDVSNSKAANGQGREGAPPAFTLIAQNPRMTPAALRKLLQLPHGDMNNVILTEGEIEGLVAYIENLRATVSSRP